MTNEIIKKELQPMTLIEQAIANKVDITMLEKLMSLQERWEKNQAKKSFDNAMANFQKDCPIIEKIKEVKDKFGKKRYSYAPLEAIVNQVKTILADNGLSYSFSENKDEKFTEIICIITHIDGHSQSTSFKIPIGHEEYMTDVQKYGARMTFGKRYAFCNAFGIMTGDEDTDGQDTDATPQKSQTFKKENNFEIILKAVSVATKEQLDELKEKIKNSKIYTDEQKKKFNETIKKRFEELNVKNKKTLEEIPFDENDKK